MIAESQYTDQMSIYEKQQKKIQQIQMLQQKQLNKQFNY